MTDDELRSLVRDAIQRHLGGGQVSGSSGANGTVTARPPAEPPWRAHPSFGKFLNLPADAEPGPCMIEPAVACNHCGFCKSYGH